MHGRSPRHDSRGGRRKKRLAARARWDADVGWSYIKAIRDSGREPDPDDFPPGLEWEDDIWQLYERIRTQWRVGMGGAHGLDYNPAIALIQCKGWRLDLALELLQVVELTILAGQKKD